MIIIGHNAIQFPNFIHIQHIDDIVSTTPNDVVWFECDDNFRISQHCKINDIVYARKVSSLKEVVIAANLGATYIIIDNMNLAKMAQKVANEYFFDSKILYVINDDDSIENIAILGIDGVIFSSVLDNL